MAEGTEIFGRVGCVGWSLDGGIGQGKSQEKGGGLELNIINKKPRQPSLRKSFGCHFP